MNIVTAFSINTPYEDAAVECVKAWARYGLHVEARGFVDQGSWERNVLKFVATAIGDGPKGGPLFIIGTDSRPIEGRPVAENFAVLLKTISLFDVVCEFRPSGKAPGSMIHSGIVGYADTVYGRGLAKSVKMACEREPKPGLDQAILENEIATMILAGGTWHRLPEGFNRKPGAPGDWQWLEHLHLSRRYKKK